jgi:Asp-tRNA(Asn)/Glu-tRNA(Gln) amidotransferase A subunit family amidase
MSSAAQTGNFALEEASIADIHGRMKDGKLTARGLVEMHLERIDAYDKKGPALNAVILVNPPALATAGACRASG